jgi:hypothetical protein
MARFGMGAARMLRYAPVSVLFRAVYGRPAGISGQTWDFSMQMQFSTRYAVKVMALAMMSAIFFSACGAIIDKNRIVIAKLGDESFTRGDLYALLRRMSDTDRPRIRNKGDLMRVLSNHIDDKVRKTLAERVAKKEGVFIDIADKIYVPMGVARDQYIATAGDEASMAKMILTAPLPNAGEETPMMREFGMDHVQWRGRRDYYEIQVENLRDKLQGDIALQYLAELDARDGKLTIDPAALEREYSVRKDSLRTLEQLAFFAIEFPASTPDATERAAKVRARIDAGEAFDTVAAEFQAKDPNSVSNSAIENNPSLEKFRTFWMLASGAEPGAVLGPVFLPSSGRVRVDAQGKPVQYMAPDSYLVLKVLEHQPERTLTLQEAEPQISPGLRYTAKMKLLWQELGMEIYEDKVPDPKSEGGGTGDPVLGY